MRQLVYLVGGLELTSYRRAREMQPTGKLETRLDDILPENTADEDSRMLRQRYFRLKQKGLL